MNTKHTLADVLWEAANELLSSGDDAHHGSNYSCDACRAAIFSRGLSYEHVRAVGAFFEQLGLSSPLSNFDAFADFAKGEVRQGVRYMWLLLAMHVAQDEGLEIEVNGGAS
jgi:hypothetical protein